jgi:multisubunit Na+/H+ antiporter MnhC subunit
VRGGALPLLAFAALLALLMAVNWVWAGDAIQVGTFAFAVLLVLSSALLVTLRGRGALRPGPPPPSRRREALPSLSVAPVGIALALAAILFGLAFGHFSIYFGCGLMAASLGRLAVELRATRETRRRYEEDGA